MKIYITGLPSGYEVEHLVRLFYPMAPLTLTPPEEGEDCVWAEKKEDSLYAMVREQGQSRDAAAPLPRPVEAGGETVEFTLASLTYDLLRSWTGIRPPWGKMTGVRPVRLIHDKRAAGWTKADIDRFFLERFDCSRQKYDMAKAIADLQEPILKLGSAPKTYSLYLGIPFCPSRCSYCSFVSCNLDRDRKLVQPYVDCLCREVEAIRDEADKAGLTLCSIYIGGGTPTTLSAPQMERLMSVIRDNFDLSRCIEFTVEGGRPDTLDLEKLQVIRSGGADRMSINPQTMEDAVLRACGRPHKAADVLRAYGEAADAGFSAINMDLIAGLPADSTAGFRRSLDAVATLNPANITVHTLALKKGADLFERRENLPSAGDVAEMVAYGEQTLRALGYKPYYLYRQKYMSGSFENVGWSRDNLDCLYNIYMMEEVHTILSLGGGGMNKVNLPDGTLRRFHNPKFPEQYIEMLSGVLEQKQELFRLMADGAK